MNTFVTSDLHIGHRNILKYEPESRPFNSTEEMDEAIVDRWNTTIGPTDETYILGDIGLCSQNRLESCLSRLNGKKYLVLGNHDHAAKKPRISQYFEWVKDYYPLKYGGRLFILFHYPIVSWDRMSYGSIHLYGHTHGSIPFLDGLAMDVGLDTNNMFPYNLDDVIRIMDARTQSLDARDRTR